MYNFRLLRSTVSTVYKHSLLGELVSPAVYARSFVLARLQVQTPRLPRSIFNQTSSGLNVFKLKTLSELKILVLIRAFGYQTLLVEGYCFIAERSYQNRYFKVRECVFNLNMQSYMNSRETTT